MLVLNNRISLKFRDIWSRKIKAFIWQPLYYRTVKIVLNHQFYLNMQFNMAPWRTDARLPCHCWPWISFSTYCQHINIHTHNTGSVIQSVKSMLCVFTGCAGEWQPKVGLTSQWKSASHVHQRSVREWYSEKVHVPLYRMNDGYCRQGRLHRGHHARGWAERTSRWRRLSVMWSEEACPVQWDNFSLSHTKP